MIKYRVWWDKIEKFEVANETNKFVVLLDGRREAKRCDWQSWHDSFEDAKNYLVNEQEKKVASLRLRLEQVQERLDKLKGMREEDIKSILK